MDLRNLWITGNPEVGMALASWVCPTDIPSAAERARSTTFRQISVPTVGSKLGETFRTRRYLFQSLKQYRDASLARLVGEQIAG